LVETVWVLDRVYRLAANEIAAAVDCVLQTDVLVVENEREVFSAMIALKQGQGSFADAVIAALATRAGCSCTLTFDQKALRLSGFEFACVACAEICPAHSIGIRALRDALKRQAPVVGEVVLHSGKSRPLGAEDTALLSGWMVPARRQSAACCGLPVWAAKFSA
jgi:hypothetical protein